MVRHRTRLKNETHAILHAHLVPQCPHADIFNRLGRACLERQPLPDDEHAAVRRHLGEFDALGEDLAVLDRAIGEATIDSSVVRRLLTITGINVTVAAGLAAAIGDVRRFASPQRLVSYFGLNPRVRQSGLGLAQHRRISMARAWLRPRHAGEGSLGRGEDPGAAAHLASCACGPGAGTRSRPWRQRASWP